MLLLLLLYRHTYKFPNDDVKMNMNDKEQILYVLGWTNIVHTLYDSMNEQILEQKDKFCSSK